MQKAYTFNSRLAWWFLLLIPLVFAGFYPTYFAVLLRPTAFIVHMHFVVMTLWVATLIIQPFLYKNKKIALHRKIGKVSYVLVPAVLATTFLMIRFSYFRFLNDLDQKIITGTVQLTHQQALREAAAYEAIAFLYAGWLALFYTLAVINRRRTSMHARYMIAAALTMLGPTVDRIVYWTTKVEKLGGVIPIETVSFFVADSILATLLWQDFKNKRSTKAVTISLLIFVAGQILYFLLKKSDLLENIVTFMMQAPR